MATDGSDPTRDDDPIAEFAAQYSVPVEKLKAFLREESAGAGSAAVEPGLVGSIVATGQGIAQATLRGPAALAAVDDIHEHRVTDEVELILRGGALERWETAPDRALAAERERTKAQARMVATFERTMTGRLAAALQARPRRLKDRKKSGKRGRPPEWDFPDLNRTLIAYVTKHGKFESMAALKKFCIENINRLVPHQAAQPIDSSVISKAIGRKDIKIADLLRS